MAEQIFNVRSGFYNAVDGDRAYSADDMNKPYKRVISDGVFATNEGTPSTDFQVVQNAGMIINVLPGNAIVASKWLESSVITPITVPANTSLSTRTDGVFLQVDNSTRTGNIVYKSGDITPSAGGKTEYLIAKISVAPGASSITQSAITDMRGNTCPWVTGLIDQVDTSALFAQWQTAFQEQFESYQQQIAQNINTAQNEWAAALEDLSGDLTVSTNIITATSFYSATGDETTIPINIAGYDNATDLLLVYINGLCAPASFYTVSGTNIILTNAIHSGDTVMFVCFKALINGSIASAVQMMQDLQTEVYALTADTGWVSMTLTHGTAGTPAPSYRVIGNTVYLNGQLVTDSATAGGSEFYTLPYAFGKKWSFSVPSSVDGAVKLTIDTDGKLTINADAADTVNIDCSFLR